uniref:Glycosyltransferase n=1 Tax=Populus trichocarpa TaxID=3694 RepID=B9IB05_POPTR|eukprot:XP_002320558.1 UDP-glycosyltransferase 74G1 [Populus trichocarpa]
MEKRCKAHCLVVSFPAQGHINPMLQFSKRLEHKGVKVTPVTTRFISNAIMSGSSSSSISLQTISDGYDEGGIGHAESIKSYLDRFWKVGLQTLDNLVEKLSGSDCPVDCIIYDAFMPWGLDVAKKFGLVGAAFFTQSCAVDSIYYHVYRGLIKLPVTETQILVPGLPPLEPQDLPSFIYHLGTYPDFFDMLLDQFSNIDRADWVFCNSFYMLEREVADWFAKLWPFRSIGPTIPSMYLDKQLENDRDYGFSFFMQNNDVCMNWLNDRAKGSVVHVSFGSLVDLKAEQMEELAWGLKRSDCYFLWVVRASEESKMSKDFAEESSAKGLVVRWCSQLEVLAHEAVGCFVTHCGWNSSLEALSLGVPMVAMPQRTDQSTNAKYITDVWNMGVKAAVDEKEIARRETIESCIKEILEGEKGKEIKRNASKWKELAKEAVEEGGSSDKNIDEFVANLVLSRSSC